MKSDEKLFHKLPKGPSRTRNTTERQFWYREKIRHGRGKTQRRGLINACFSKQKRQENGTESEKLRRWQNTTDSSAVLFLVRKGPLGNCPRIKLCNEIQNVPRVFFPFWILWESNPPTGPASRMTKKRVVSWQSRSIQNQFWSSRHALGLPTFVCCLKWYS